MALHDSSAWTVEPPVGSSGVNVTVTVSTPDLSSVTVPVTDWVVSTIPLFDVLNAETGATRSPMPVSDTVRLPAALATVIVAARVPATVAERVPPYVIRTLTRYYESPEFVRSNWAGTHWQRMREVLAGL